MKIACTASTRICRFFTVVVCVAIPSTSLLLAQGESGARPLNRYVLDHWSEKDGLPQNGVYGLLQSRDGYLWFGSQEGLVRFDGVRFTVFDRTNTREMKRTWVARTHEDRDGTLWFAYNTRGGGIGQYRNGSIQTVGAKDGLRSDNVLFEHETHDSSKWFVQGAWGITREKNGVRQSLGRADGLPCDTVYAVSDDSHGNLWFATSQGIVRHDQKSWTLYSTQNGMPANRVWWLFNHGDCVFEDSRGSLWMPTDSGLVRFEDGRLKTFTKKDGLLDNRVDAIYQDSSGTLWFVSKGGVNSLSGGVMTAYNPPVPFEFVRDYFVDADNSLWIATVRGLWRFKSGKFDRLSRETGLADENVNTVLGDAEGSLWFGTDAGGLYRLREGKFVTYASESGLKDPVISAVMEDSKGNLWLTSEGGSISKFSGGSATVVGGKELLGSRVNLMAEDRDGVIWLGSRDGLFTCRNGVCSRYVIDPPLKDLRAVFFREDGDLVIADANTVYTLAGHRLTRLFVVPGTGGIATVMEDTQHQIWVGVFGTGAYRFNGDSLVHFQPKDGFDANQIYGMFADREGCVWIGTENDGAYLYKEGKFTQFSPANGFFSYNVANIIDDEIGSMWFSDNKGVYRIKKQALEDYASGKATSYAFDAYGTADGMKSMETNFLGHPNVWRMRDGRIVFPTVNGAAIVDPARIRLNTVPPRVVLERFTADNAPRDLRSAIDLNAGTNNIEIQYVGLTFIGSSRIQYKYRLEGYEKDWVNPGSRNVAYYTHLGPGDYKFRVIAANADGIWDSTGASASFIIRPHFYEAGWFYAFAAIGLLFVGPSIYLLRVRQLKLREAELARQVDVRTQELRGALDNLKETQNQLVLSEKMASLGQLTAGIAHEIKNPLNFITNFAALSGDLAKDLRHELSAEREHVDPKRAAEIGGLLDDLEQNVNKINEHGKRADSIVRGMLLHSRGKAGERQDTDLNALLAEYTNLAYHGMRAQDTSFNIKIETDLDPSVGKVSVVPQDLSRAFLNIVNNACYAANDRKKNSTNGFSPVVRVSDRNLGDSVEIRVRDNGTGIPRAIVDKIFNPFFTTKPAGAGTGLGLSLSYDIITQVHKGQIKVDTKEGEFTEFIISIPRNPGNDGGNRA